MSVTNHRSIKCFMFYSTCFMVDAILQPGIVPSQQPLSSGSGACPHCVLSLCRFGALYGYCGGSGYDQTERFSLSFEMEIWMFLPHPCFSLFLLHTLWLGLTSWWSRWLVYGFCLLPLMTVSVGLPCCLIYHEAFDINPLGRCRVTFRFVKLDCFIDIASAGVILISR